MTHFRKNISGFLTSAMMILFLSITVLFVSGCDKNTVIAPSPDRDNLQMSIYPSSDTIASDNIGILVIDTVKILVKDIKYNPVGTSDSTNFKTGPFVVNIYSFDTINTFTTGELVEGSYSKVMFEIHKPGGDEVPIDPEFVDANGRYSVIVKGSYAGVRFVYKSDKSAKQILNFPTTVNVNGTVTTNVTLRVAPYTWFISGGVYLDPNITANANDIDNNIKDSFKAFKDDNKDGTSD